MPAQTVLIGGEELTRVLKALGDRAPMLAAAALTREAEAIMTEAKKRTPVLTGALRASGQVSAPEVAGSRVTVTLGFGNSAVRYAIFVHENLTARHANGEAKFLERPMLEAAKGMEARLAASLRTEFERAAR